MRSRHHAPWLAAIALAGLPACGSRPASQLPPAAGPVASPALTARPAGRVVRVGHEPEGVAADAETGLVAVALRAPDELAVVDARTGAVRRRVRLPSPARHLEPAGGEVLVPAERAGRLLRVSLRRGRVSSSAAGGHPHDAVEAAGATFVVDRPESVLARLHRGPSQTALEPEALAARSHTALEPEGLAAVERGRAIAVLAARERVLELFDARTVKRIGRAPAGTGPTHMVSDGGELAYVVDTKAGALLVFRTRPELRLTRRYPLGASPYGVAFDPRRGRIWVTLTATNELVELAAGPRPHRLRTFPAVRQPNSVAVEPSSGRVFVAGRAQGVLQLLDPPPLPRRR